MNESINWVSFADRQKVWGFELSGIHIASPDCAKPAPGFVIDAALPIENGMPSPLAVGQANFPDLTPQQRGHLVSWWHNNRYPLPDGLTAESFCRIAVANFGVRILSGDTDERIREALGKLQQDHQPTFLRTGVAENVNHSVQFAALRRGTEHHRMAITRLR